MAVGLKNTRFEAFRNGVVDLWVLDDKQVPKLRMKNLRYQLRVVGSRRNYLAQQAGVTIKKLIRVPIGDPEAITPGMFAVIGGRQYKIESAQAIPDTVPKSMDLTLVQPEILQNFDREEAGAGGRL